MPSFSLLSICLLLASLHQVYTQLSNNSSLQSLQPSNSSISSNSTFSPSNSSQLAQLASQASQANSPNRSISTSNLAATNSTNNSSNAASSSPHSSSSQAEHLILDTKLSAPFGILGALLIISGTPMAFWGGRNRWSSYFLTGAYVAAIIVMVPILRFGVIEQDHQPTNVIQGVFVLACLISAFAAGAMAVVFWKGTKFLVGAAGGFVISLFILSVRSNTLIRAPGLRWIFIVCCIALGFVLATVPAIAIYVTLFSTAALGAAAVVLGVDCFTTGGLKEFWIYIIGFGGLFPKLNGYFPLTVTMQAELGVMAGLFVMGAAIQWRLLEIIRRKITELKQLDRERRIEEDAAAYRQSMALDADLARWEKQHGSDAGGAGDADSATLAVGRSPTKSVHQRRSSQFSLLPRSSSSPQKAYMPVARRSSDVLPGMDLGGGLAGALGLEDSSDPARPLSLAPDSRASADRLRAMPTSTSPARRLSTEPLAEYAGTVSIDFEKFEADRRVARPPGAPTSWTRKGSLSGSLGAGNSPPTVGVRLGDSPKLPGSRPISYPALAGTPAEEDTPLARLSTARPVSEYVALASPAPRRPSQELLSGQRRHSRALLDGDEQIPEGAGRSRRQSATASRMLVGSYEPGGRARGVSAEQTRRESQVMTIEQLEQRHKMAMRKLQDGVAERTREEASGGRRKVAAEEAGHHGGGGSRRPAPVDAGRVGGSSMVNPGPASGQQRQQQQQQARKSGQGWLDY